MTPSVAGEPDVILFTAQQDLQRKTETHRGVVSTTPALHFKEDYDTDKHIEDFGVCTISVSLSQGSRTGRHFERNEKQNCNF